MIETAHRVLAQHRIFYLGDSLNIGGTECQLAQVAIRLKRAGLQIEVGCITARGPLRKDLESWDIPIHEFSLPSGLSRPSGLLRMLKLARFLRNGQFDVVHTHDVWSNLLGVPAAFLAHVPVIVSSRRDLASWWWYTPRKRTILKWVQGLSDRVVANSNAVRDMLVRDDGFDPQKITVVRNGVDLARFEKTARVRKELFPQMPPGSTLVAVVANMNNIDKGHQLIVEAASKVCPDHAGLRFALVGDGSTRAGLEERVRTLGLSDNFLFLGSRSDVPDVLASCDLSLLASAAEGLPNAVLESMAAGLPVIATAVGGTPEVIEHGLSGLLVPPEDPEAVAEMLRCLINDPVLARSLGAAARERVRHDFSFDRVLTDLEGLYSDLLSAKGWDRRFVRATNAMK